MKLDPFVLVDVLYGLGADWEDDFYTSRRAAERAYHLAVAGATHSVESVGLIDMEADVVLLAWAAPRVPA